MRINLDSPLIAKIVEWDEEKGYGFLQVGNGKVFLHRRDFAERHKRPAVGDEIRFTVGQDAKGRTCAKNAAHMNDGGRITALAVLLLACLLVLPAIALYRNGVDLRWSGAYVLTMGAVSFGCYALDKRRAREHAWRISENALHLTELLGGWPGAFLAQRKLRHKVSKPGFQFLFWLIVLAYQFAAFDSLQNWQFSRAALDYLERTVNGTHTSPRVHFVPSNAEAAPRVRPELVLVVMALGVVKGGPDAAVATGLKSWLSLPVDVLPSEIVSQRFTTSVFASSKLLASPNRSLVVFLQPVAGSVIVA